MAHWFGTKNKSHLSRLPDDLKSAFLRMAAIAARALPEQISLLLWIVWLEDTRGSSLRPFQDTNDLSTALREFLIWCKETGEAAEREGKVDTPDDFTSLARNWAWLFFHDKTLTLKTAHLRHCDYLRKGKIDVASSPELDQALERISEEIFGWLDSWGIPFQKGPSLRIPTTSIHKLVSAYQGLPDMHFAPNMRVSRS